MDHTLVKLHAARHSLTATPSLPHPCCNTLTATPLPTRPEPLSIRANKEKFSFRTVFRLLLTFSVQKSCFYNTIIGVLLDFQCNNRGCPARIKNSVGGRDEIHPLLQCYSVKILFARIDRAAGRIDFNTFTATPLLQHPNIERSCATLLLLVPHEC